MRAYPLYRMFTADMEPEGVILLFLSLSLSLFLSSLFFSFLINSARRSIPRDAIFDCRDENFPQGEKRGGGRGERGINSHERISMVDFAVSLLPVIFISVSFPYLRTGRLKSGASGPRSTPGSSGN